MNYQAGDPRAQSGVDPEAAVRQSSGYVPYKPNFPSMAPTAQQFNYKPPTESLQHILGGLKGTGSTFGMPWQAGYTAQPGITTPMMQQGTTSPLNPQGLDPHPFTPQGIKGNIPPPPPTKPQGDGMFGGQGLSFAAQNALNQTNHTRSLFGMPPLAPGSPEFAQWMKKQNMSPAWANVAGGINSGGQMGWMPAERSGGEIAGGRGGYPGGHEGSFAGGSGGGDIGAGSHGGHPTY